MKLQLIHTLGDYVEARWGDGLLFRYVYRPRTPANESPKPYLHPVHTLAGELVTLFRPHDHTWHHGMCMTCANLSGENFWGGATYVHGQGYVQLDNNGRTEHLAWDDLQCDRQHALLSERLHWVAHDGEVWLAEKRQIRVSEVNPDEGYWELAWDTHLTNLTSRTLAFGSPTTAGRTLAGYGGLMWRGPRSFTGGQIMAAGGLQGPEVMGQRAAWLAYVGAHDGSGAQSTLVFIDDPSNVRYPIKWFVRNDPALASFAFSFDELLHLERGADLRLRHRIVIADGAWSRERIEGF
jgi:hypothetical protein